MNKIVSGTVKGLLQVIGVIVTLFITGLVGALMQKGYWVETISITIGILALAGLYWLVRGLWYRSRTTHEVSKSLEQKPSAGDSRTSLFILFALLGFGVAGGLFYWFQVRPSQIRKECDTYARGKYSNYNAYTGAYTACLHKYGLE